MIYNYTIHYAYDPLDNEGYDDEMEADNIQEVISFIKNLEDYDRFNYYVIESEDGEEYYNTSEEPGFEDRC